MELELIEKIRQTAEAIEPPKKWVGLNKGIGDDCAELSPSPGHKILLTTDTMVEGVHFSLSYFDPYHLGRRLAAVNLSDIAAMGGVPRAALLNIEVPRYLKDPASTFWKRFALGLVGRLKEFGAVLVGGDTVASPCNRLGLTLTLTGEVEKGGALYRNGASVGDMIYCSGYLGESACGLLLLKKRRSTLPFAIKKRLIQRHLDPEPRIPLGRLLKEMGATSAIDVSDGIATDIAHIARGSGVKAVIEEKRLPLSRALKRACRETGVSPTKLAISGGEDFELVWTISPKKALEAERRLSAILGHAPFLIGRIKRGKGLWLKGEGRAREITFTGYEH